MQKISAPFLRCTSLPLLCTLLASCLSGATSISLGDATAGQTGGSLSSGPSHGVIAGLGAGIHPEDPTLQSIFFGSDPSAFLQTGMPLPDFIWENDGDISAIPKMKMEGTGNPEELECICEVLDDPPEVVATVETGKK